MSGLRHTSNEQARADSVRQPVRLRADRRDRDSRRADDVADVAGGAMIRATLARRRRRRLHAGRASGAGASFPNTRTAPRTNPPTTTTPTANRPLGRWPVTGLACPTPRSSCRPPPKRGPDQPAAVDAVGGEAVRMASTRMADPVADLFCDAYLDHVRPTTALSTPTVSTNWSTPSCASTRTTPRRHRRRPTR